MYQIKNLPDGSTSITDGVWDIPTDPANSDYQEYLAWLAEGNEPEVVTP